MSVEYSNQDLGQSSVSGKRRMVAPDLARGFMLLLIVLAHAPLYLVGVDSGVLGLPAGGSVVDQSARIFNTLLVDARAYPMFAALFGYGLVLMLQRRQQQGVSERISRRLVRRRGAGLVVLGLGHAVLITPMEILGAYGVATLLVGWLLFRPPRSLAIAVAVLAPVFMLTVAGFFAIESAATGQGAQGAEADMLTLGALGYGGTDMIIRVIGWAAGTFVMNIAVYPIVLTILLGALAAKYRVLEDPDSHRGLLAWCAFAGVAVAVAGAVPLAWIELTQTTDALLWVWQTVHVLTGIAGGVGYTAIFGLLGQRFQDRRSHGVALLSASGKRSLTCYLIQSAVLVLLLSQTFVGLGDRVNSAGAAAIAVVAWLTGLLCAVLLERTNHAGPAEALLRRFVNRPLQRTAGPAL